MKRSGLRGLSSRQTLTVPTTRWIRRGRGKRNGPSTSMLSPLTDPDSTTSPSNPHRHHDVARVSAFCAGDLGRILLSRVLFRVDGRVNFGAVNRDFLRCFDPQSDFVTTDLDDVMTMCSSITMLSFLARQNQHGTQLSSGVAGVRRKAPASHERVRTANPAAGVRSASQARNRQAFSRGTKILCPAARQNQAGENEKSIAGQ